MARGSQTVQQKGKVLFANVKNAKQNEKVHFEVTSKASKEADLVNEGTETGLSGKLIGAEHRKWGPVKDGPKDKDSIVLRLSDPNAGQDGEIYKIEVNMGSIARSIINSLLSAQHFNNDKDILTIRLYNNDKGYASVWVGLGIDGAGKAVALPWKLSVDDMNKFITKEKKKSKDENGKIVEKVQNNYIELDAMLLELFQNNIVSKMTNEAAQQEGQEEESAVPAGGSTDDLPF